MPFERIYSVAVDQANALAAASDPECTRALMAGFYADCLRAENAARGRGQAGRVDWSALNAAILKRWPKGLLWIKRQAHRALGGVA